MHDDPTTPDSPPHETAAAPAEPAGTSVRPLESIERRVLGVLIEKGKTTPDQYPLSLNALVNGCNQKSNRAPVMSLDEEQVMRAVRSLQASGAVSRGLRERQAAPLPASRL